MGYELKKLMNMYGVSTPTMAPAPQMPGAAPTALAEGATAEQQAKYATDKAAFDESVRKYGLDKAQYDQYAQEYQNRLANTNLYNQAQFSTTGANVPAFTTYSDAQKAALGYGPAVTPTVGEPTVGAPTVGGGGATAPVMPQPGPDASNPNPVVNPLRVLAGETKTQYLERVKGMGTPNRGQNAPPGMMFGPNDALVPDPNYGGGVIDLAVVVYGPDGTAYSSPGAAQAAGVTNWTMTPPDPNSGGTILPVPQPGPQDFSGIGQGGLNQQIQSYMGTNPSMPDLNAYMTRYGLTDYDIRNAMGTGTTYGTPQWTDMLASPVYGANYNTGTGGTTVTTTGGTTGTTGTTTGGTTGTTGTTTGTVYDPTKTYWTDPNWKKSDAYKQWQQWRSDNRARGGYIQNYAQGGTVQGYQRGGPPGTIYGGAGDDVLMGRPADDMLTPAPAPVAEDPQDAMRAMLESYIGEPVDYSSQIAAATERRAAEQKALEELLMGQMNAQDSAPESKAELYLRLAAAFGAPTKTGHFSENLGLAGQTMADELAARSERERAAREKKLGVQTELQKMRLDAAGEDVDAYRGLQESETEYRRDLAKNLMKDYIDSGKPQTEAAKMASDMGLTPGTPEYNEKVREIIALDIAEKKSLIDARLEMRDNVPAAFKALDYQARAAGFLPESEGGDGSYEEFMATRGSGLAAEARAIGTARGEATAAAPGKQALFELIEFQVNDLLNDPYLPNMLGYNAYLPNVSPESKRVQSKMEQISGGAFLQARQLLKGGGAITDFESKKAESAFIRMNEAMTEEDFRKAMNDFLDAVRAGLPKLEAGDTAGTGADLGLSDEDMQYIGGN